MSTDGVPREESTQDKATDQHLYLYSFGPDRVDVVPNRRMYPNEVTKWDRANPTIGKARSLYSVLSPTQRDSTVGSDVIGSPEGISDAALTSYKCRHCADNCCNPVDSQPARCRVCWTCLSLPSLEERVPLLRSSLGLELAESRDRPSVEEYGFIRRHAECGPHPVWIVAQQLGRIDRADPPTDPPSTDGRVDNPSARSQRSDPEATPLARGVDPEADDLDNPSNPPGGDTRTPASASVSDGQKPGSAAERAARNVPRSDRERFPLRSDGGDDGEPL